MTIMKHSTTLRNAALQRAVLLLETCIHPLSRQILVSLTKHHCLAFNQLCQTLQLSEKECRLRLRQLQRQELIQTSFNDGQVWYAPNSDKLARIKLLVGDFSKNYMLEEVR